LETLPAVAADVIRAAGADARVDSAALTEHVRLELQRVFRKQAGRRPLVLPVILEI
jgi:mRNA degradation ribonuclease J1/J2